MNGTSADEAQEEESPLSPLLDPITTMSVAQLQDALRTRKQKVSGRKAELIERFLAFLNEENKRGVAVRSFTSRGEALSEISVEQNSIENDGRRSGP